MATSKMAIRMKIGWSKLSGSRSSLAVAAMIRARQLVVILTAAGLSGCYAYMPRDLPSVERQETVMLDRAQIFTKDGQHFFLTSVLIRPDSIIGNMRGTAVAISREDVDRVNSYRESMAATTVFVALGGAALLAWGFITVMKGALR